MGLLLLAGMPFRAAADSDMAIYTDSLLNSWDNWSWSTTINFANSSPVHAGPASISANITAGNGALSLHHANIDTSTYTNLTFWIHGGSSGGQLLQVYAEAPSGTGHPAVNLPTLTASTWQQVTFTLSALGIANRTDFARFSIQDRSGSGAATFYVDDMKLTYNGAPPTTNILAPITVNAQLNQHAISPFVYGVAFASATQLSDLNSPLNRSGGNSETRYNWLLNAHNHAADWYFESLADDPATPGAAGDSHITASKNGGGDALITIPMIGWMPKVGPSRGKLASFSIAKYGAQTGSDSSWMPDAGNGISTATGNPFIVNDPTDANFLTNSAFQQAYVQHLISTWGNSTNGGVKYYLMDNEHSIWHSTHRDVHPVGATMVEIRDKMFEYAAMVKSNDANALVLGPEEFGWSGYFNSGYDLQNSGGHDRAANGGWDYMPWLLNQFHQRDTNANLRLLDYFTLHCYPEDNNVSGSDVSASTQLLRSRLTRKFWDTNYVDDTWIGSQSINIVKLIPRMKDWVNGYYPGTKIGITEYNWGAEEHINGATAQADLLGIFGREGLDLATRWTTPNTGTPTYNSIKMYRNYDGSKSTFGDTSVSAAVGTNIDLVSSFAAVRSSDGALTVMVINKQAGVSATLALNVSNFVTTGTAQVWQLTSNNVITNLSNLSLSGNTLNTTVPLQSITLFVLPAGGVTPPAQPVLNNSAKTSTNTFAFTLNGEAGRTYVIQYSPDLISWYPISTNTLSGSTSNLFFPVPDAVRFYRAKWGP
jgi:hypothetical protein